LSRSNAEIVVPLFDTQNDVWGVLDVDSRKFDAFSDTDKDWLEKIVQLIQSTEFFVSSIRD
jgi:GAF domain-containing protein